MAIAVTGPALAAPWRPTSRRAARAWARVAAPCACLAVSAWGIAAVAGPVLGGEAAAASGPVSVAIVGSISTTGLPESAPVSVVTLRNDGASPLQWSARPSALGPGASGLEIDAWAASRDGCAKPTMLLGPGTWSASALRPGESIEICVRVRATGVVDSPTAPRLDVAARAL